MNDIYGASDLRNDVEAGRTFYVPPYIKIDAVVDETDVSLDRVPPNVSPSPDSWAFTAEEEDGEAWYFLVDPNDGGPNDGVVYCFWTDGDDGLLGHHEVYPRAVQFVD